MWRAFLAALWLVSGAHAALGQSQASSWPNKPVRISVPVTAGQRDRPGLPHGVRPGVAAGRPALHHRQPRRRRRNAGPGRGRQGGPRRLHAALPLALAHDLPGDPQHAALRYRARLHGRVALVNTPFLLVVSPAKYKSARELVAAAQRSRARSTTHRSATAAPRISMPSASVSAPRSKCRRSRSAACRRR